MRTGAARQHRFGLLAAALLLVGCSPAAQPVSSTFPAGSSTQPQPTIDASIVIASPQTPSVEAFGPPAADLVVGGTRTTGSLGSWTWTAGNQTSGDTTPWLRGTGPVVVKPGAPLEVTLSSAAAATGWTAAARPAAELEAGQTVAVGEGSGAIRFNAPGSGSWSLAVTVRFPGGNDATYYWRLETR